MALPRCLIAAMALVVAGCASGPAGRPAAGPRPSPTASTPPSTTASAAPKKSGGYYLDDGPGANPPADLDLLPDAVPKIEKYASGANRPYNVFGVDYVPDLSGAPYKQRGVGSWYGRKFHGQRTSSGEIYDMYAMTAAHPTLPIPCYALVTNLQNGKSVIVRVNDRGPFLYNRVMDLSYAAALKLGYLSSGSGTIEVELLLPSDIAAGRIPITSNSLYVAAALAAGRRSDPGATTTVVAQAAPLSALIPSTVPTPVRSTSEAASPSTAPMPQPTTPVATASARPTDTEPVFASAAPGAPPPMIAGSAIGSSSVATSAADRGIPPDLVPSAQPPVRLPETAVRGHFYLQLGAFRVRAGAESFASHVAREIDPLVASKIQVADLANGVYRVRIGPYEQRAEADTAATTLRSAIAQPVMVMPDAATR